MGSTVRAIDLGFGHTKFTTVNASGELRYASFPSLALASVDPHTARPLLAPRRTVSVRVAQFFYEVGPDVLSVGARSKPILSVEGYTQSADYKALMLGALHYMQADEIDVLVVGLPVSEFTARKSGLERLCVGEHDVGKGRKVKVHKALVVAQPQGALVAYAEEHGLLDQIGQQENLIIDCGTRTLDWLTARGLRLVANRSYSAQYGVHDVVTAICDAISREIGEHYDEPHIVDEALRTGRSITTYGKAREIQRYMPIAERIAAEGIQALTNSIGGKYRFANIVLSGGGAYLFRKALRDAFKKQPVLELADPFYANVRGFQRAGVDRVRAQAPTDASQGAQHEAQ